jgi:hypothetical protein
VAPHELVLFPETADLPVEWAVLGRDPGRPGLVLVVPADTYTKKGTADVAVPDGSPLAPLTLRCGFGAWIDEARLKTARRTGDVLDSQGAAAARQLWDDRERGESVGSLLTEEVDADPEYKDWIDEVLVPARAALTAAPATAQVVPLRRHPAFFGNPLALAASVLLVVCLSLAAGLVWQDRRIEEERARAEEIRQQDQEKIAALERRLQDVGRPEALLNVPLVVLAPRDPGRGPDKELTLPAFFLLAIKDSRPFPSYRLDILSQDSGGVVWKGDGLVPSSDLHEVSLVLRRDDLPPGDYELRLYGMKDGGAEPVGDYDLRIARR